MTDIPVRELRNNVSQVLRRVEAGERLRVTVSGRPVAELLPLSPGSQSVAWETFVRRLEEVRADASLADELRALIPELTDDLAP